jgi:hypothetical protein
MSQHGIEPLESPGEKNARKGTFISSFAKKCVFATLFAAVALFFALANEARAEPDPAILQGILKALAGDDAGTGTGTATSTGTATTGTTTNTGTTGSTASTGSTTTGSTGANTGSTGSTGTNPGSTATTGTATTTPAATEADHLEIVMSKTGVV